MLEFYPRIYPWDYLSYEMTSNIPYGKFYLFSEDERVPRTSKPTEFTLVTDRTDPVRITMNGTPMGTVLPKSEMQPVYINLYAPPTINYMKVDNGVDAPVYLTVASTYMTSIMEMTSREIYSYAAKQVEKYYNLLHSRWSSFIMEYQLPWRKYLAEIRSLRILSVKSMAIGLVTEAGTEGGVTDFLSAFTHTTPVFKATRNPELWQPDLYQPVTSAEDVYGWEGHVWIPNFCVSRWVAFSKLVNNVDTFYDLNIYGEDVVTVSPAGTDAAEAHLFDTLSTGCSVRSLIEFLGCLDGIAVTCNVSISSDIPICAYATPYDQIVEHPGIGGGFFDEGDTFDTAAHEQPDEVNIVTTADATNQATAILLATDINTIYNAHDADPLPTWHFTAGGAHQLTAALPIDMPTLRTFCIDAQTEYALHLNDAAMHTHPDVDRTLAYIITATSVLGEITAFLNDMKAKLAEHQAIGNLDSIYDVDLLTDYWVGTSTKKAFDYGKCLDRYPTLGQPVDDVNCCISGPDTVKLTTLACTDTVVSANTPNNPIFGGDIPGLLENPYFDEIA